MILIAAENRELALSISINQRNPCHDCTSRDTGYYLALTFGTLLSSQRADAQKIDPRGPRPWLDVQHYAGFQCSRIGALVRRTSRAARRMENSTPGSGPRAGGVPRRSSRRPEG